MSNPTERLERLEADCRRLAAENDALKRQLGGLLAGAGAPCPDCGGPTVALRSRDRRVCNDCKTEHDWKLGPGQKPLLGSNRQDRTTKD